MAPLKPKSRNFDVTAALKSGYTQAEVDDFLATAGKGLIPVYTEATKNEKLNKGFQEQVQKSGVKIDPNKKGPVIEKKGRLVNDLSQVDQENMDMAGMPPKIGVEDVFKMILEFYGNPNQTNLIEPIKKALDAKAKQSSSGGVQVASAAGENAMKGIMEYTNKDVPQDALAEMPNKYMLELLEDNAIDPKEMSRYLKATQRQWERDPADSPNYYDTYEFVDGPGVEHPDDAMRRMDEDTHSYIDKLRKKSNKQHLTNEEYLSENAVRKLKNRGFPIEKIPPEILKHMNPTFADFLLEGRIQIEDIHALTPLEQREWDRHIKKGEKLKKMNKERRLEGQKMWNDDMENIAMAPEVKPAPVTRGGIPNMEYWKNKPLPQIDHFKRMGDLVKPFGIPLPSHVRDEEGIRNYLKSLPNYHPGDDIKGERWWTVPTDEEVRDSIKRLPNYHPGDDLKNEQWWINPPKQGSSDNNLSPRPDPPPPGGTIRKALPKYKGGGIRITPPTMT